MILSALVTLVIAILAKLLADDSKEWAQWLTRCWLALAIRSLPVSDQERYREEWAADLDDTPGTLAKLIVAVQLPFAAWLLREADAKARADAWTEGILTTLKPMLLGLIVIAKSPNAETLRVS